MIGSVFGSHEFVCITCAMSHASKICQWRVDRVTNWL